MAAAAAAIAAAAVSAGATAYSASQQGKGKKKTTQTVSPQQTAIQQIVTRALLDRYVQGPQTFGEFRAAGGKRENPQLMFTPFEAQALGMMPRNAHQWRLPNGIQISPQYFTPDFLAQQRQAATPEGLINTINTPPNQRQPWVGEWGGRGPNLWWMRGEGRVPGITGGPTPETNLQSILPLLMALRGGL